MTMREVTKDEFYRVIYAGKLDVHPNSRAEHTEWNFRDGSLFGRSDRGYRNSGLPGDTTERFWLVEA